MIGPEDSAPDLQPEIVMDDTFYGRSYGERLEDGFAMQRLAEDQELGEEFLRDPEELDLDDLVEGEDFVAHW